MTVIGGAGGALLAGLVYFIIAAATIRLTNSHGGIAPIWPANAVLLAMVLLRPRRETVLLIVAGMIGNGLAVMATGGGLPDPFLYAGSNLVELVVATLGLRSDTKQYLRHEPRSIGHMLLWSGLLAPAASACFGALTAWYLFGHSIVAGYLRWFLADSLGLLIFTPFVMTLLSGDFQRGIAEMDWKRRGEFAGLLALTALTTCHVFLWARYPLLFLVILPMMLTTFRAGWLGSKIALTIVAVISGGVTIAGLGPIAAQTPDPDVQVYGVQMFIAAMLLLQLPIAAALAKHRQLVQMLQDSEQSLRLLASRSPILLISFDLDGICKRVVGTSDVLLDRDPATLVGASFATVSQEGQYELRRAHNDALDDVSQSHTAEFRTVKVNDAWLEAVFRAHFDEDGRCVGTIATIHDVTTRKNQELSLSRTATTDSLTGLLNRAGFRSRLDHALLNAAPGALSVAIIDVDRFKLINDNRGHQVGDLVLKEIAQRISGQVRTSDAVGRLGGDEFVILLATPHWETVQEICARIVTSVNAEPVALPSGNSLRTAISCGVSRFRAGLSADDLIHEADVALYEAKRGGRNRVVAG
ncbi:sensor domain-containing diguanylate cyclase [Sphingobium nicotianae]|uniref:Diguanylate cyclase n=1 Tax=Sphingobium nicotianae TaxID=2782607 RepID=A0A9X1DBT0_9SPHN|nr:diguanylate cyclase [Sphingobium nicotianae]